MKILAINTAFQNANVILDNDGNITAQTLNSEAKSSEKILPTIEKILTSESISLNALNVVGVVVGTGSFTGVRIAVAMVKGFMCCNKNLKTVAINSLDLMAYEFVNNNLINGDFYCVQNALSGRFFIAKYDKNANLISKHSLVNELPNGFFVGLESDSFDFTDKNISFTSNSLLQYTKKQIKNNNFVSLEMLTPVYLRLSQAEENLMKKEEKSEN